MQSGGSPENLFPMSFLDEPRRSEAADNPECVLGRVLAKATVAQPGNAAEAAFAGLHHLLRDAFPRLHTVLCRETVGSRFALLYTWHGDDPEPYPWAILAHQDVVAVEGGTEAQWTHGPFAGEIAGGYVWGRGALDMKSSLVAVMQAIEDLIAGGFRPQRTLMLCLGADEEIGGDEGAARIAALLRERGIRLSATLDEGGIVLADAFPGVPNPVALIGVAQKGTLVLRLTAMGEGGHGALPGRRGAIARLARCVLHLESAGLPAPIEGLPRQMLLALAGEASALWRVLYRAAVGVGAPVLRRLLRNRPIGAAIGSTMAVTRFSAGVADNVVPQVATATLDIRLRPGDDSTRTAKYIEELAARFGVTVEVIESIGASRVSSADGPFFDSLASALRGIVPNAAVVPYLTPNDTDSKHFADIADAQYRFVPLVMTTSDLARLHGKDERISVANYRSMVTFYRGLILTVDSQDRTVGPVAMGTRTWPC
jgi:carboxypeptidase PM20D1